MTQFDVFSQIDFDKLSSAKLDFKSFKTENIETSYQTQN